MVRSLQSHAYSCRLAFAVDPVRATLALRLRLFSRSLARSARLEGELLLLEGHLELRVLLLREFREIAAVQCRGLLHRRKSLLGPLAHARLHGAAGRPQEARGLLVRDRHDDVLLFSIL